MNDGDWNDRRENLYFYGEGRNLGWKMGDGDACCVGITKNGMQLISFGQPTLLSEHDKPSDATIFESRSVLTYQPGHTLMPNVAPW